MGRVKTSQFLHFNKIVFYIYFILSRFSIYTIIRDLYMRYRKNIISGFPTILTILTSSLLVNDCTRFIHVLL